MKLVSIHALIFLCSLFLLSCETETEQYNDLRKEYEKLSGQAKNLQNEWRRMTKEQEKSWQSTARERFAFLYELISGKWYNFDGEEYVQAVQFEERKAGSYRVNIRIRPDRRMKPLFHVYLHDHEGLIVGHLEIDAIWAVPAGKEREYSEDLAYSGTPHYFRLDIIED